MDFTQKPTEPEGVIPEPAVVSMDNPQLQAVEPPVPRHVVWLHRLSLVVFVVFCIELGMLLAILPWTTVWNQNSFLGARPALKALAQSNFVRGLATGIGLVDIWIGIWEAVHYRDPGK
jgi:succinate dehydrogenase/fumarate reductase cytochrome b subunit